MARLAQMLKSPLLWVLLLSGVAGGFVVIHHILRPARAANLQNPAVQLLKQAAPAPWSRIEREIAALQQAVRENPRSSQAHTRLGQAYLQKARETADPSYLTKADALFKKSLELDEKDFQAIAGMGSLCLSRHEFGQALGWAEKGLAINAWSSELYGIMGDACVELGEYERAVRAFQKMVDLRPQLSSYSRVSYVRELYGDIDGAIESMKMAISAGAPNGENTAWCRVQLGNLYLIKKEYPNAEQQYLLAMQQLPGYVHSLAGLAKLRVAQGGSAEALALYEKVVQALPMPEYVIALGDLYEVSGRHQMATRQYELVKFIDQLYKANGVDTEMEMALFGADHDLNTAEALVQAKRQFKKQPNIKAADVLAWTFYKAGQYEQARAAILQALRLGTQEPLFLYHAGMIYSMTGETVKAKDYLSYALKLNPHFSIRHATEAKQTLDSLREERPSASVHRSTLL